MNSRVATGVDLHPPAAGLPPPPPPGAGRPLPSSVVSSHSTYPVAESYERTRFVPISTSSVRAELRPTTGELHVERSARLTFHSSLPVFVSSATTNDFSSLSHWTKRRSPSSAGEALLPQLPNVRYAPRSFCHSSLPS